MASRGSKVNGKAVSRVPTLRAAVPALLSFGLTALAVVAVWWWLGSSMPLPPSALAPGEKLTCVSYAPFRGAQDPLVEGTRVAPEQIDEDLALLAKYTNCIRTYSVDDGRDDVLKSARRYGLKVMHGVWVSGDPEKPAGRSRPRSLTPRNSPTSSLRSWSGTRFCCAGR